MVKLYTNYDNCIAVTQYTIIYLENIVTLASLKHEWQSSFSYYNEFIRISELLVENTSG